MSKLVLDSLNPIESKEYASYRIRGWAHAIDFGIFYLAFEVISRIIKPIFSAKLEINTNDIIYFISLYILGALVVIHMIYTIHLNSSKYQGTIGKKFFMLKITDERGERITSRTAIIRYFAVYITLFFSVISIILWILDKRKQAIHDKIAGTLVYTNSNNLFESWWQ